MEYNKPSNTDCCPTATHIGYLAGMLAKTTGPVVELGTGHYSTPMLHHVCKGRQVLSVDTDSEWLNFFKERYESPTHEFFCTQNKLLSTHFCFDPKYNDIFWDVAFIDNSPAADRIKCLKALRGRAKFIVVHDTELTAAAYGWGDENDNIFDTFKYSYHCPYFSDRASVVSDFEELGIE